MGYIIKSYAGFTFLELLLTVTLLVVLSSLSIAVFAEYQLKAMKASALTGLNNVHIALTALEGDTGLAPGGFNSEPCVEQVAGNEMAIDSCEAGLVCRTGIFPAANWKGPYILTAYTIDPWGNTYQYDSDYLCNTSIVGCENNGWVRAINTIGPDGIMNNYDNGEAVRVICRE